MENLRRSRTQDHSSTQAGGVVRIITGWQYEKETTRKSDKEIDELVIAQADDDSAWEKPIQARRSKSEAVSLHAEVASRFLPACAENQAFKTG